MTLSSPNTPSLRAMRVGLGAALAAGVLLGTTLASSALAQPAPAAGVTPAQTEGPFFKAGSPETTNLLQDGMPGMPLTLTGQVVDQNGQPVANALLDFWQADANGNYDNRGYTLRGHQFTDGTGNYTLTTIVPGLYTGRTEHIHVKVQAPNGPVLTTQLYFPGVAQNARDGIFNPSLLLNIVDNGDGTQSGTFTFVVAGA